LTTSRSCCSSLFTETTGGPTRENNYHKRKNRKGKKYDGQSGGDKHSNKKNGITETTDGTTGGDKPSSKKTGTTGPTGGQTEASVRL
jgi:hypothetical protein